MGTRNLTAVFLNGEYKVAQYGQWDGYPDGQGITCLHFLRDKCDMPRFREAVSRSSFMTSEELNALLTEYGMKEDGMISYDDYDRFNRDYPELSRDSGGKILEIIQNSPDGVRLRNNITFAADSIFCEWAWVVDLDKGTFEGYKGFNHTPLAEDDRFFFLAEHEDEKDYGGGMAHGVKLAAKWNLDNLPSDAEFLAAFQSDEEDEAE